MPLYEFICNRCGAETEHIRSMADRNNMHSCPIKIDNDEMCMGIVRRREVQSRAPALHSSDYNTNIAKMKQASKEHFVKKEIDDVRHKFGRSFDDGLVGAAAERIRGDVQGNN